MSPTWTMSGRRAAAAVSSAVASATPALAPTCWRESRTFTPRMRSRCASIVWSALALSMKRTSSSSPTSALSIPVAPMLRNGRMRVCDTSMTYRRKAVKVKAPALPASTTVVVPVARQWGSGSMP